MDWTAFAAVASVCGTIGLGLLSFVRGSKADRALNTATTVQSTFTAQRELVDNLQEETTRLQHELNDHRQLISKCESECRQCRSNLSSAHRIIAKQEEELEAMERLRLVVGEHEQTIAKHERTISSISRRDDMKSQPRQDNEERRNSHE